MSGCAAVVSRPSVVAARKVHTRSTASTQQRRRRAASLRADPRFSGSRSRPARLNCRDCEPACWLPLAGLRRLVLRTCCYAPLRSEAAGGVDATRDARTTRTVPACARQLEVRGNRASLAWQPCQRSKRAATVLSVAARGPLRWAGRTKALLVRETAVRGPPPATRDALLANRLERPRRRSARTLGRRVRYHTCVRRKARALRYSGCARPVLSVEHLA